MKRDSPGFSNGVCHISALFRCCGARPSRNHTGSFQPAPLARAVFAITHIWRRYCGGERNATAMRSHIRDSPLPPLTSSPRLKPGALRRISVSQDALHRPHPAYLANPSFAGWKHLQVSHYD